MNRINLHDVLAKHTYEHAIFCTYVFDARFFEGYCLDRFAALRENNNITVLLDRGAYDELVAGGPSQWPRLANTRYLLHPIRATRTFHPKIFLLASRSKGLLVVGSANLTKPGITSNAELVGVYHYDQKKHEQHRGLFRQAIQFLRSVANRWPGAELSSNLDEMLAKSPWLATDDETATSGKLIHNLERSMWSQISEGITAHVDAVHVLSRYFDETPHQIDNIIRTLAPRRVVFWTQNQITTMTPAWLSHPLINNRMASIRLCSYEDDGHRQPLHAKAIAIVRGKTMRLAYGSANFTTAGMFSAASNGNVETMLCIDDIPLASQTPEQLFDPGETAEIIENSGQLKTAALQKKPKGDGAMVTLEAASVDGGTLICQCAVSEEAAFRVQAAILTFSETETARVELRRRSECVWIGHFEDAVLSRCDDQATIVHIEGRPDEVLSNRVLLVNLQDIVSNRGQRRERRIHEAQQSAAHFSRVLDELLAASDMEALIRFLNLCDIRVIDAARPLPFIRPRQAWTGDDEMRRIGDRNLREYVSLHEAAVSFCKRHIRRLDQHCKRFSIEGITNFMHIAVAVGNVLRAQIERVLIGFEHMRTPFSNIEWGDHRDRLEIYLELFKQVMHAAFVEYMPNLNRIRHHKFARAPIGADLAPLVELWRGIQRVRDRVNACMGKSLAVRTPSGNVLPPLIRADQLLGPQRWHVWDRDVQAAITATTKSLGIGLPLNRSAH